MNNITINANHIIYIYFTEFIDKKNYIKILETVLSVHDRNYTPCLKKYKVVVFINCKRAKNDYFYQVYNLLSTIKDNLYTIAVGDIFQEMTNIFFLADKNRRYRRYCFTNCFFEFHIQDIKDEKISKELKKIGLFKEHYSLYPNDSRKYLEQLGIQVIDNMLPPELFFN